MRRKKIVSMLLVTTMAATLFAGCGNDSGKKGGTETGSAKEFDAFFAVPGTEINDDNEIQKIIEEKTGVRVKETWLTGQTADEAIGTMIAGGEYPDFIEGASGQMQLYDAGALVPLDDYIEKYPNIKKLFTDLEWEKLRQDDGHIYWIPQFSCIKGDEKVCTHNDEAFWIQARVLKWAGYPKIDTLDKYFDLIEKYNEANPKMADGTENIPYTILCDDWRYFCLENAPQFLDGYPNDGSCMVDPDTKKVLDYNTSDTAVKYFKKLNEEYQKGIVDPESFTQTYDEYISKLSTGRVLGMIDQWWDFAYTAGDAIKQAGLDEQGCDYIPVPVTIDGRPNQWHNAGGAFNESTGLAVTTSCDDVDAAMKFVNDLLDQDIHNLRFWGVKGTDYEVDENGEFYKTADERKKASDTAYKASHSCSYSYFPQYNGTSDDGINAAGGNDNSGFRGFQSETSSVSSGSISITGGTLKLVIEGDGIDSNGDITICGGEIYVNGPANGGNASLDYDGEAKITGGIFVAAGPSEMALNFSTSSTQGAMLATVSNQTAGTAITLKDASVNTLISWEAESDFSSVLISLPELEEGSTYTLETGSSSTEITMTSLIYGSGGMQTPGNMQSPGGMEPGNHQGMGGNRMP